jgi:glycosyltransferase involved in cell wall biosynthesis
MGAKDYAIGNHPVWELFRTAYQMTRKPFILRGLALGSGYLWALMQHADRPVSRELIAFLRREQMHRLTRVFTGKRMSSEGPAFPQGNARKPSEGYERAMPAGSVNVVTARQPSSCLEAPGTERGAEVLKHPLYVLVTSARDEAQFIESTIRSVLAQTMLPLKWVIVSDGSTDGTDDIVKRYAAEYEWIELLRMAEREERNFAGKAHAVNAGQKRVADLPYQVIVCLDADVVFDSDYFSYLLGKLAADPKLGLVGTPFHETSQETYDYRFVSVEHVSGPCQAFRRECFEAIGGYVPVKTGSIDHIAVISARMKGWKTRTFTEKYYLHSREMGTAQCGPIQAKFKMGAKDYAIGNHLVWELFRTAYQMTRKPFVLRGLALAAGYVWASMRHAERQVSREFIEFQRREQMHRLTRIITRKGMSIESSTFPLGNAREPR